MIYLDNSATTKLGEEVLEAMLPWLRDGYGNASSVHSLGRRARVEIDDAREEIAAAIGARPAELIFTSGGTESNNAVLKSALEESALADKLAVSAIEHHAVLRPAEALRRRGFDVEILTVNADCRVSPEMVAAVNHNRTLLSVMHANNETGAIQPIASIRNAAPDALLHVDAVQSLGKIHLRVDKLGVDFASFSAHKIHGPKGVGALFIRKGIDFKAHQQGGGQERNRRAGTEPVALIAGFRAAVRTAVGQTESYTAHTTSITNAMRTILIAKIPSLRINTPSENALPNILNVSFTDAERLDGEAVLQSLDMRGIAASNGSACVSGSMQPSHTLSAMGLPIAEAKAAVRFSVSKFTDLAEAVEAAEALVEIIANMRE
ncbi:cysteine desulfurase NifS [Ignavibacteria bacterium]|nr:cysteine desulfurase [Bacteroidota bacterium]MCZ2131960.1 cysteine desulfurase [Bacteroidota bacterium]